MIVWQSSSRVTNSSAERSQTARPSRLANTFFSRSWKREDWPAAGRMTAKRDMATPRRWRAGAPPSYRAACPVRQFLPGRAQVVEVLLDRLGFAAQTGVNLRRGGLG